MKITAILLATAMLSACGGQPEPERRPFTVQEGFSHAVAGMAPLPLRVESRMRAPFARVVLAVKKGVDRAGEYIESDGGYWQTPEEFLAFGGECRGYAVTYYYYLYRNGVADSDMQLLVVQIKSNGIFHAILRVEHGGRVYVLDNRAGGIEGRQWLRQYKVLYGFNRLGATDYRGKI